MLIMNTCKKKNFTSIAYFFNNFFPFRALKKITVVGAPRASTRPRSARYKCGVAPHPGPGLGLAGTWDYGRPALERGHADLSFQFFNLFVKKFGNIFMLVCGAFFYFCLYRVQVVFLLCLSSLLWIYTNVVYSIYHVQLFMLV